MINFQRIINEHKEGKRKTLGEIEDSIYHMEEGCFNGLVFPCIGCFGDNTSIKIGIFVADLEKNLGKTIPLLRKFKEEMQFAKKHYHKRGFSLSRKRLLEAEKYLIRFKKDEFEKVLTIALKKSLKKVQL